MRYVVSVIVAFVCTTIFAVSHSASTAEVQSQLEKLATSRSQSGGLVVKPGKGRFAFVSMQSKYTIAEIQNEAESLGGQLKFPIGAESAQVQSDVSKIAELKQKLGLDVAIFFVDIEAYPMSVVAMEEHWAIVNVGALFDSDITHKLNAQRLHRETSRVAKALFSGVNTTKDQTAVSNGKDLDALATDPIDSATLVTMLMGLSSYGLVAPRTVPYYRACREGWAPAPTNDVQKAIWDKVHAMPTEPIKIKPEEKKTER